MEERKKSMCLFNAKARTLVNKGCIAYVSLLTDASLEYELVYELDVVSEFPNMFLVELPELPPNREFESSIGLLPGTIPISKAPSGMSPAE